MSPPSPDEPDGAAATCSTPTDGALDFDTYQGRRADIEHDVQGADTVSLSWTPSAQEPAAPVVRGFTDMWPTRSIEVRRGVGGALLTGVRLHQDKTVEVQPRWGEPVTTSFTKRGSMPPLPTA